MAWPGVRSSRFGERMTPDSSPISSSIGLVKSIFSLLNEDGLNILASGFCLSVLFASIGFASEDSLPSVLLLIESYLKSCISFFDDLMMSRAI